MKRLSVEFKFLPRQAGFTNLQDEPPLANSLSFLNFCPPYITQIFPFLDIIFSIAGVHMASNPTVADLYGARMSVRVRARQGDSVPACVRACETGRPDVCPRACVRGRETVFLHACVRARQGDSMSACVRACVRARQGDSVSACVRA